MDPGFETEIRTALARFQAAGKLSGADYGEATTQWAMWMGRRRGAKQESRELSAALQRPEIGEPVRVKVREALRENSRFIATADLEIMRLNKLLL